MAAQEAAGNQDPAALRDLIHEGLSRMYKIEATFGLLEQMRQSLLSRETAQYAVWAFFEDVKAREEGGMAWQGATTDALARLTKGSSFNVKRAAYIDLLRANRSWYTAQVAEQWAQRRDVRAFIGQSMTVRPVAEAQGLAVMEYGPATAVMHKGDSISGMITDVSVLGAHDAGRVGLEDVRVGDDRFSSGAVRCLFGVNYHQAPPLLTPLVQFEAV